MEIKVEYLRVKSGSVRAKPITMFLIVAGLVTQALDARQQRSVSDVQKRNMMESVIGPQLAPAAVVLTVLQPKIALSCRWRKKFNVS